MQTITWLQRLIAHDTTSSKSNLAMLAEIENWLSEHHIKSHLSYDETRSKANLLATLPASDGGMRGGIMFSGHSDVVPVTNQVWDTDPFQAKILDDKVYGRGACDMKGFIACVLAAVPTFKTMRRKKPVHFAISFDEEVGCAGAPLLIKQCKTLNLQPQACIVGEPSNMQAIVAHKGIQAFKCTVRGKAAHSSLTPAGCNAIEHAAAMILYLRGLAKDFKEKGPFDADFDVAFSTLSCNQIQGGIAINTIPELCQFIFELRQLPPTDVQGIIQQITDYSVVLQRRMQEEVPGSEITIDMLAQAPAFQAELQTSFTKQVMKLTETKEVVKVAYATEAGLFQQANIPTIVCGPGSINEAHRANEYVSLQQLQRCEQFLKEMVSMY